MGTSYYFILSLFTALFTFVKWMAFANDNLDDPKAQVLSVST